jgi:hypothetical protein
MLFESMLFLCLTDVQPRGEARVSELKALHATEMELTKSNSQAELSLARSEGVKRAESLVRGLEAAAAAVTRWDSVRFNLYQCNCTAMQCSEVASFDPWV